MKPATVARSAARRASLWTAARCERSLSSGNRDLAVEELVADRGCKISLAIVALRAVRGPAGPTPIGDILADATGTIDRPARGEERRPAAAAETRRPALAYIRPQTCPPRIVSAPVVANAVPENSGNQSARAGEARPA